MAAREIPAEVIRKIHQEPANRAMFVIAMAGNGSQAISELMRHGRGSDTLLAYHLLYVQSSLYLYLGFMNPADGPKHIKAVSEDCACRMAMAAYQEALRLRGPLISLEPHIPVVGMGCTSALVKPDGERAGRDHAIHIAIQTARYTRLTTYHLTPSASREDEEWVNALAVLYGIVDVRKPNDDEVMLAVDPELWMRDPKHEIEHVSTHTMHVADDATHDVLHNEKTMAMVTGNETLLHGDYAVFSGSFNPLHDAHIQMAEHAAQKLNRPVIFELSITNTDKPPLDYLEIKRRVDQFRGRKLPLVVTNRPKFMSKSEIFKAGTIFVTGIDTYDRIGDERYYRDGTQYMQAMSTFRDRANRFLVYPRTDAGTGKVKGVERRGWHDPLFEMAVPVAESEFLMNVSSTDIRNGSK